MNKQINLIINGKGGGGKSFFPTTFVRGSRDRRSLRRAVDSDRERKSTIERVNAAASPNRKDIELLRSVFRAARLLSAKSSKPLLPLFPEMQSSRVVFPSPQLRRLRCAFIPTSA